jgi:hypothetical protein
MNSSSSSNHDTVDRLAEEFAALPRRVGRRYLAESPTESSIRQAGNRRSRGNAASRISGMRP